MPRRDRSPRVRWAIVVAMLAVTACSTSTHPAPRRTPPVPTPTRTVPAPPAAPRLAPVVDWGVTPHPETVIQGFAGATGVLPGQRVALYVSTSARSYRVDAFRMGWYGGTEAARIWASPRLRGVRQPAAAELPATRTDYAPWRPSLSVSTRGWPPGAYLFRLSAVGGASSYVPLTVCSPTVAGRVVLLAAVTTWQAYNTWGGRSLYAGPSGYAGRAYAVSFDRPYALGLGAADFLQNELPLVSLAERLRLPLAYETDVTLDLRPALFADARAIVSPGHDEYYSPAMRAGLTAARAHGVNIAFLGANAIYRHIRFASTALGRDRLEIDYKDFRLDPVHVSDPAGATTVAWTDPPVPRPESVLTGAMYQCNPVAAPLVVADAGSWLLAGLALHDGERFGVQVGTEYDAVDLSVPTPRPIEVVFHSPVTCGHGRPYADVSYYTTSSGAGVFDASTSNWVCALADGACGPGWSTPRTETLIRLVTARLLGTFALGPAGGRHPAVDNLARLGLR